MRTIPTTLSPGETIKRLRMGSYVHVDTLPGSRNAAKSAASRAARDGEIVSLRRGLYFKGKSTRYGVVRPPTEDVALEVLGRRGVGPTGVSAARALGLTTQVPVIPSLATTGPLPTGIDGVRISKRNNIARRDLTYTEIAVLEVLRDWKFTTDRDWNELVKAVSQRVASGDVRPDKLAKAGRGESRPDVRAGLQVLVEALPDDGQ